MATLTKHDENLQRREELLHTVKNAPFATTTIDWLAPYCDSTASIAQLLRDLGFKIKDIVDETTWYGVSHQWVETFSGLVVYVNDEYERGQVSGFNMFNSL